MPVRQLGHTIPLAAISLAMSAGAGSVALVELLRGVAAFFTAPLLIHMAVTSGPDLTSGVESATWVTFGLLLAGVAAVAAIVASGGLCLQAPDIDTWQEGEGPAIDSAPLGAALRRRLRPLRT